MWDTPLNAIILFNFIWFIAPNAPTKTENIDKTINIEFILKLTIKYIILILGKVDIIPNVFHEHPS